MFDPRQIAIRYIQNTLATPDAMTGLSYITPQIAAEVNGQRFNIDTLAILHSLGAEVVRGDAVSGYYCRMSRSARVSTLYRLTSCACHAA